MKWFEGSMYQAVQASKAKKAIFVVFVSGKDDASIQVSQVFESSEISSRLEQEDFVAVHIESGSETYMSFAQIYHFVLVPSIFFIGKNGFPLEIFAGTISIPELATKIDDILVKSGKRASGSSLNFIQSEQEAHLTASANVTTAKNDSVSQMQEGPSKENEENTTVISHEEKVKRAQHLIELQKRQSIEEEMKKEKERELERRKRERELQELRLKQRELEIKQSQEERLKEKAADEAARKRVRQQIAQDRLMQKEKEQALQNNAPQQQPEKQVKTSSVSSSEISIAKIQFRLPSGSTHRGEFESTATLGELRNYVVRNIELPDKHFAMFSSFPKRNLFPQNDSKTLMDLGLVPTSVIFVLPGKNPNEKSIIKSSEELGLLSRIIWSVFTPIIGVYNYVMRYFFGRDRSLDRQQNDASGTSESTSIADGNIPRNVPSMQQPPGLRRRNLVTEETKVIRTQGNIHRLHSARDDNDENNTWNGNSTQQM